MAKQQRTRKSAPQNKAKSFQDALVTIDPWSDLDEEESRVFQAIINSREKDTWVDIDVERATKLARVSVQMDREWDMLQEEGTQVLSDKGWPATNPRIGTYSQMAGIYQKMHTALGLSASQRGIAGHKQAGRNQQDSKAIKSAQETRPGGLSLLAKPSRG